MSRLHRSLENKNYKLTHVGTNGSNLCINNIACYMRLKTKGIVASRSISTKDSQ
jgi:hypothetical protein